MLESPFKKVGGLKARNFVKKRPQHKSFPVNIVKYLRTVFLKNTSGGCFWQSYHSTVVSSTLPLAFDLDQKLALNVTQIIFYYHMTKQFFICLNWLNMCFQFQNMFWKKQVLHKAMSKDFLHLYYVVDQVLSISGYDLENERMLCK